MTYRRGIEELNDRITKLRQAIARRDWLQRQREALAAQMVYRRDRAIELAQQLAKEQRDVEKLEGKGLTAIYASVLGSKDEKLEKERQEFLAAKLKHDEALAEIAELEASGKAMAEELGRLENVDDDLAAVLYDKEQFLREQGGPEAVELLTLSEQVGQIHAQVKEIDEALTSGNLALEALGPVLGALDSAKNWGTFDLVAGGIIATAVKHGKIDEAKQLLPRAQSALFAFNRELRDVQLEIPMNIDIDDFDRFTDYFFDGLIADWSVQSKIENSRQGVRNAFANVTAIVNQLYAWRQTLFEQYQQIQGRRDEILETWG